MKNEKVMGDYAALLSSDTEHMNTPSDELAIAAVMEEEGRKIQQEQENIISRMQAIVRFEEDQIRAQKTESNLPKVLTFSSLILSI